jgi:hypothetical protein
MQVLCLYGEDYLYLGYPMHLTPTEFGILHALQEKGTYDAGETPQAFRCTCVPLTKRRKALAADA